jgi:hypothetical protein
MVGHHLVPLHSGWKDVAVVVVAAEEEAGQLYHVLKMELEDAMAPLV